MLTKYIDAVMKKAHYELLTDDHSFYGEVLEFPGVYANATSLEDCRNELREVLEDWILLGISRHSKLPVVDGISLKIREVV